MSRTNVSGHFIDGAKGPIFVLLRRPVTSQAGCVLVVPPLAEEMNKTRRMVTEVALGLADRGFATLVPDLYGTGDSGGDFADADWTTWQDDLRRVAQWAAVEGAPVTGMLATRLGCALAATALASGAMGPVERTVLWQPVFDGGRFLAQFLRLRTAASLMEDRKESLVELRDRLQRSEAVEVAGYALSGALAADLDAVRSPAGLPREFGHVCWMEVVRAAGSEFPVPSQSMIEQTRSSGGTVVVSAHVVEPFWAATEIVRAPGMVADTVRFLAGTVADRQGD